MGETLSALALLRGQIGKETRFSAQRHSSPGAQNKLSPPPCDIKLQTFFSPVPPTNMTPRGVKRHGFQKPASVFRRLGGESSKERGAA